MAQANDQLRKELEHSRIEVALARLARAADPICTKSQGTAQDVSALSHALSNRFDQWETTFKSRDAVLYELLNKLRGSATRIDTRIVKQFQASRETALSDVTETTQAFEVLVGHIRREGSTDQLFVGSTALQRLAQIEFSLLQIDSSNTEETKAALTALRESLDALLNGSQALGVRALNTPNALEALGGVFMAFNEIEATLSETLLDAGYYLQVCEAAADVSNAVEGYFQLKDTAAAKP
jgi:hypothetical protein